MPAKASIPRRRNTPSPRGKTKSKAATRVVRRSGGKKSSPPSLGEKAGRAGDDTTAAHDLLCCLERPVNRRLLDKEPEHRQLQCPGCGERKLWRTAGKDGKTWFGCAGPCSVLARDVENGRAPGERGRSCTSTYASYHPETQIFESWVPTAVRAASHAGSSPPKQAAPPRHSGSAASSASEDERSTDGSATSDEEDDDGHPAGDHSDEELPIFIRNTRKVHASVETTKGLKYQFTVETLSETFWYYLMDAKVQEYMEHFRGVYALEVFHAWEGRGWMPYAAGGNDVVRIVDNSIRFRICHAAHEQALPAGAAPELLPSTKGTAAATVFDLTIGDSDDEDETDGISVPMLPVPARNAVKAPIAGRAKADAPKPLQLAPRKTATASKTAEGSGAAGSTPKASTSARGGKESATSASKRAAARTGIASSGAKAGATGTAKRASGSASSSKGKRGAVSAPEGAKERAGGREGARQEGSR
ncbi:hypothetical protein AURDEDRAFT_168159 [Auricularia subglabra TFB-10046 SS5]|nr:hypothetical protein AURDEDRAFT_168159 [Auricularia subglabra TFB-10046 SS5]